MENNKVNEPKILQSLHIFIFWSLHITKIDLLALYFKQNKIILT